MAERRATFAVGDHRQRGDRVAIGIAVVPALILDLHSQPRIDDGVIANELPADAGYSSTTERCSRVSCQQSSVVSVMPGSRSLPLSSRSSHPHAVDGGADLIDAKDPLSGTLGAVSLDRLRDATHHFRDQARISSASAAAACEDSRSSRVTEVKVRRLTESLQRLGDTKRRIRRASWFVSKRSVERSQEVADGPIGHMSPLSSRDFVRESEVDALVHADIDDVISHVGESVISDRSVRRRAEDREGCLVAQQMRERTCDVLFGTGRKNFWKAQRAIRFPNWRASSGNHDVPGKVEGTFPGRDRSLQSDGDRDPDCREIQRKERDTKRDSKAQPPLVGQAGQRHARRGHRASIMAPLLAFPCCSCER